MKGMLHTDVWVRSVADGSRSIRRVREDHKRVTSAMNKVRRPGMLRKRAGWCATTLIRVVIVVLHSTERTCLTRPGPDRSHPCDGRFTFRDVAWYAGHACMSTGICRLVNLQLSCHLCVP